MEEINNLCLEYGFTWDTIGSYIKLRSKRDSWAIDKGDLDGFVIKLGHFNNYGGAGTHKQGSFSNIEDIFKYIKGHDNKHSTKYNKVFKIDQLLKAI